MKPQNDILTSIYEVMASAAIVILIFLCSMYSIILGALGKRKNNDKLLRWWGQASIRLADLQLDVRGLEKFPPGGAILIFNHVSLFDILIIYAGLPDKIRFGAKIELFSIPFFGQAMQLTGTLPIARNNLRSVQKVYAIAADRTAKGERFALAPEGTRQLAPGIGEFKLGPFVLAIEAQAPIVPVVIKGAEKVMTKASWFISIRGDRKVYVDVLSPMLTKGLKFEDRHKFKDEARQAMQASYAALPN